jgi:DNA-binding MarR family transcriptional regulator
MTRTVPSVRSEGADAGRQLADLAFQLGRLAYGECAAGGLTPAQWTALRYFDRANRFSRTVSAFAEYHATTRGTASQTIKSLVSRGLLRRSPSARDGRSSRLDLTPAARRVLAEDPLEGLVRAAERLPRLQRLRALATLRTLVRELAQTRQRPAPGRCALCGHLGTGEEGFRCRLMEEPLERTELEELCIRFVTTV